MTTAENTVGRLVRYPAEEKRWLEMDSDTADGPGSMSFRLENNDKICAILESQPATHEDNGEITQSPTLTVTVQCREKDDD